jgi:hypothetical protein
MWENAYRIAVWFVDDVFDMLQGIQAIWKDWKEGCKIPQNLVFLAC